MPIAEGGQSRVSGSLSGPSLRDLVVGIGYSTLDGFRLNKLASVLALLGLIVFIPLTFGTRYDERPRYREVILPDIQRLESRFEAALKRSVDGPTAAWQLYHFIDAHRRAKDVLDGLKSRNPVTPSGRQAHDDLILYYELANEHMAIIRTQMSLALDLDFLARWEEARKEIQPLRDRWAAWVGG
jgi:hypothetical protein